MFHQRILEGILKHFWLDTEMSNDINSIRILSAIISLILVLISVYLHYINILGYKL